MRCACAWVVVCLLVLFFAASPLFADELATLTGYVSDPSGYRIPKCQVQVTNVATGVLYVGQTNDAGLYRVPALPVGTYRVVVQKQGFKTVAKQGIELHVQDVVSLSFHLDVGSVAESVSVPANAPLVNTESATVSTVIDRRLIEAIPLNGQSFNTLLQLTPGTVIVPSSAGEPGQFSINGQRSNANYFQVDGVGANFGTNVTLAQAGGGGTQAFNAYGGTASLVSVDAVQEFRVETSSFAPEYGRTPGGQVSITTRSGTNEFHGDIFNYFRNTVLDANSWFANAAGNPRAPEHENDFGGVFGGPLLKDRTFFFVSYEGLRLKQPQTTVIEVPSVLLRQATTTTPTAAAILKAYPLPNGPVSADGTAQFTGSYSNEISMDAISLRVDQVINSHLNIFGRANYSPSQNLIRSDGLSTLQKLPVNTTTVTFGINGSLTSNVFNSTRINLSKQEVSQRFRMDSFGGAVPIDPSILLPGTHSLSDSSTAFTTFIGVPGLSLGTGASNGTRQWNLADDLSVQIGTHEIKVGANYDRLLLKGGATTFRPNYFLLNSLQQFASDANVQVVDNALINPSTILFNELSLYAQDRWKFGQRLILTYGFRWDLNPAPTGVNTSLASWLNVNDPPNTRLAPIGTPIWRTTYLNFAPRIGFAYQLSPSGDFIFRGGTGVFYDLGTGTASILTQFFPNIADFFKFGSFTLPIADPASITPAFSLNPPYPAQTAGFSPNLKLPYSYQWNLALERSFSGQQALSATYLGQFGRRLLRRVDLAPNSNFSQFFLTTNGDTSDYNALQIQYKKVLSKGLQALLNYSWSHSIDTSSSDAGASVPSFFVPTAGERGSSAFDVRQNFTGAFTYTIPGSKRQAPFDKITQGWSLSGFLTARSGVPIDIFSSEVIGGTVQSVRPDLVAGQPIWITQANAPGGQTLNPAAFAVPTGSRQGSLPRNSIYGFSATQLDASVQRSFSFSERTHFQLRCDAFNVLNHPNFANPSGKFPSSQFGQATQMLNQGLQSGSGHSALNALYNIGGPRSMQLSLKVLF
jgi:hypothetical protein